MTILATIVVLGVLIFVNELGHFMAAKSVGVEVQRFSIGLPPRMFGFRKGDTEYVIGWVPLGGYVKMGGMGDEVMERLEGGAREGGAEEQPRQPKPSDFDGKPLWARAWVISAGVIMNMLFAFVVYAGLNAVYRDVSLVQAVQLGYAETVDVTWQILAFLRDLVTGGVSPRSVGSIVTIGAVAGQAAQLGLETFLRFMALLSVNLAVFNLLPIPVLDGGHLVFLSVEAIRGKTVSLKQRLRWSQFGVLVVLGIMILALSNDILRLFGI